MPSDFPVRPVSFIEENATNGETLVTFDQPQRAVTPGQAVVFYDGGNVYNRISIARFINDYTNTVGVGLRYDTPVGPVRFDIGHNLNPVTGFRSNQFFVTLGQAF